MDAVILFERFSVPPYCAQISGATAGGGVITVSFVRFIERKQPQGELHRLRLCLFLSVARWLA